jgi:hypothetical protein
LEIPLNHPCIDGFSLKNQTFRGTPFMETSIIYIYIFIIYIYMYIILYIQCIITYCIYIY